MDKRVQVAYRLGDDGKLYYEDVFTAPSEQELARILYSADTFVICDAKGKLLGTAIAGIFYGMPAYDPVP